MLPASTVHSHWQSPSIAPACWLDEWYRTMPQTLYGMFRSSSLFASIQPCLSHWSNSLLSLGRTDYQTGYVQDRVPRLWNSSLRQMTQYYWTPPPPTWHRCHSHSLTSLRIHNLPRSMSHQAESRAHPDYGHSSERHCLTSSEKNL